MRVILDPRNVLVLNFGQLGDVVLSLPALAAIRKRFPQARITVAGGLAASLVVEMSGSADRTLAIDRVKLRDGPKWRGVLSLVQLVGDVRRTRYDLVIDLHSLSESNVLGWLSGAPERVFAQRGGRSLDFLATVRTPWEERAKHQVDRYLDVLAPWGIRGVSRVPHLPTRADDDRTVQKMLDERGVAREQRLIGLFPGASQADRRWPLERFAELAARLEKSEGARAAVFLGPEEAALGKLVRKAFSSSALVFEELTLSQFASAAARLELFISNDTGPMHLAAAVGTPVLLLLGAPVPGPYWFGPVGEHHRMIARKSLGRITVADVFRMAREMMRSAARGEAALSGRVVDSAGSPNR